MNKHGIFNLLPGSIIPVDNIILKANTFEDIEPIYNHILSYLKYLNEDLTNKYSVPINNTLTDFYDKFTHLLLDAHGWMFDASKGKLFTVGTKWDGNVNIMFKKESKFNKKDISSFSITNPVFSFEHRKLQKLINHCYNALMDANQISNDYFYIPLSQLRCVFTDSNVNRCKDDIVKAVKDINKIHLSWDIVNYNRRISENNLDKGKYEKMMDVSLVYLPLKHLGGKNQTAIEIKGIIVKVTNFMKLRYAIKQRNNDFPIAFASKRDVSTFVMGEKIIYQLNILQSNHKELIFNKKLSDIAKEIYYDSISLLGRFSEMNYYAAISNLNDSKRIIIHLFNIIIDALKVFKDKKFDVIEPMITIGDSEFDLLNDDFEFITGLELYNSIEEYYVHQKRGSVKRYLISGDMNLYFQLQEIDDDM